MWIVEHCLLSIIRQTVEFPEEIDIPDVFRRLVSPHPISREKNGAARLIEAHASTHSSHSTLIGVQIRRLSHHECIQYICILLAGMDEEILRVIPLGRITLSVAQKINQDSASCLEQRCLEPPKGAVTTPAVDED